MQVNLVVGVPGLVADEAVLDAVLTASRTLVAVATQSLGAAAEDITLAQYRALVVLASRGPQRLVDLAGALGVTPSTAGRMGDRLVRKGLIRRQRSRADRRSVQVSITAAGREVVDQATARRRELPRRGYDVDRAAPSRGEGDLTAAPRAASAPAPQADAAHRINPGGDRPGSRR
jgi:DNA-binding MarR family transcriptional regulator